MNPALPPWLSRAAALLLLAAVLGGLWAGLVAPLLAERAELQRALAENREQLARYLALSRGQEALRDRLAELEAAQADSGIYLSGDTDALVGAELQDIVNDRIEANGGRVRSVQILPVDTDGEFRRVGVRVQFQARIAELLRILHALESSDTTLFIDSLDVSNRRARRRGGGEDLDPELLIRLDMSGYLRPSRA